MDSILQFLAKLWAGFDSLSPGRKISVMIVALVTAASIGRTRSYSQEDGHQVTEPRNTRNTRKLGYGILFEPRNTRNTRTRVTIVLVALWRMRRSRS